MPARRKQTAPVVKLDDVAASGEPINIFAEMGSSGLKRWGGLLDEEFHRDLKGNRDIEVYTEMRANSPIVGASELAISSMLRGVKLRVEAGEQGQQGEKARMLVDTALEDMSASWPDTLSEILTFMPYGWAWDEIVYKKREGDQEDPSKRSRYTDGMIGWRKWSLRGQSSLDKFQFDDSGGIQGMVQRSQSTMAKSVLIPIEKSALFRTSIEKNNPKGRSILRSAYIPYYASKRIQAIEGIGIERDLAGYPVLSVPMQVLEAQAGTTAYATLEYCKTMVRNTRRDDQEGALIPSIYDEHGNPLYKFELMSAGGSRQFDVSKTIERHDRRIAMAMLCDIVMLGHEKVGSFALADSKQDLLSIALGGWLDAILGVINRHLIPRLLKLNGLPVMNPPVVRRGDIHAPNLQELGAYLGQLTGAGMITFPSVDGKLESHMLGIANLPAGDLGPGDVGKRNADIMATMIEAVTELRDSVREARKAKPVRKRAKVKV